MFRYTELMDELSGWLLSARDGDVEAFEHVVRSMQAEIWRFSYGFVGEATADDVTQETFLAAWRSLPLYRGEASARTWLYVIARRTALRTSRRNSRRLLNAEDLPTRAMAAPGAMVEIEELLSRLDDDRRVALLLTQVMGFSYAEAAAICECPVGTIRSRVARARTDLLEERKSEVSRSFRLGFAQ